MGFLGNLKAAREETNKQVENDRATIGGNGGPSMFIGGEGWVAIHRGLRNHWLVGFGQPVKPMDPAKGSFSRTEAWVDLIMECRYEAGTIANGGQRMALEPGQLLGAISWLGKRWNWTPQTVRTFLDKLEADGMISRHSPAPDGGNNKHNGKQANIITVCNYSTYQVTREGEQQAQQQASNKQATSTQQASNNIYIDNKETKEQELNPPTPQGGVAEPAKSKRQKKTKSGFTETEIATSNKAVENWNAVAVELGFDRVVSVAPSRRARLVKRLAEIGGLDQFNIAIGAIKLSPFLMGKEPPRNGQREPFRLDFDRLLQTEGNLGDVLCKLIDKAASQGSTGKAAGPFWKDPAKLAAMTHERWRVLIAEHAINDWPSEHLGPAPGKPTCVVPKQIVAELRLCERFDQNGLKK